MKRLATILCVVAMLMVGACTPPYFGVSLRFQRQDAATLFGEVRTAAEKFGFADEAIVSGPVNSDWKVLLRMRGRQIVRREPLTLMVVMDHDRLSVGVGRRGGLGIALRPEEIALIRAICAQLQALRGFSGIEREVGMNLVDSAAKEPNQSSQPTPGRG